MGGQEHPGIEKPAVAVPRSTPPSSIIAPRASTAPSPGPPPTRPGVDTRRLAQPLAKVPTSGRHRASDRERPRTLVTAMTLNRTGGRVALSTADGPPYRGDAVTDLPLGAYWLGLDRQEHKWVFEPGRVRAGLRFALAVDGPDPFTLDYVEPLLLLVTDGLGNSHGTTLAASVRFIVDAVRDHAPSRYADAVDHLSQLDQADLYDVIDALEIEHPGVAGDLFLHFIDAVGLSDMEGQGRVLRALESFVRRPEEYYIDGFDHWLLGPGTWRPDPERERAGLRTGQLVAVFDRVPPKRAVTIYFDDISDSTDRPDAPPRYGPLGLTYPRQLSRGTTPRLHAARVAALAEIERQNLVFIKEAFLQSAQVLLGTYQAATSIARIEAATLRGGMRPRAERGPGRWEPTPQAGRNMSPAAEAYEMSSCGTPKGMGYYVDGVQFEGFKGGRLLDAKHWLRDGRQAALMRSSGGGMVKISESIMERAARQLAVAGRHGVGVEWRVADREVAEMLARFMRVNKLDVRVIHIAP